MAIDSLSLSSPSPQGESPPLLLITLLGLVALPPPPALLTTPSFPLLLALRLLSSLLFADVDLLDRSGDLKFSLNLASASPAVNPFSYIPKSPFDITLHIEFSGVGSNLSRGMSTLEKVGCVSDIKGVLRIRQHVGTPLTTFDCVTIIA